MIILQNIFYTVLSAKIIWNMLYKFYGFLLRVTTNTLLGCDDVVSDDTMSYDNALLTNDYHSNDVI